MLETTTTILAALAMFGHSVLGCHWHHDHCAHAGEFFAPHLTSDAHLDHEQTAEIGNLRSSATANPLATANEVPDHESSIDEASCSFLKRPAVCRTAIEVMRDLAGVVLNAHSEDPSSLSLCARHRLATALSAPSVRALSSVRLL